MLIFSKDSRYKELYDLIIRISLFVEYARYIAEARQLARDDFELIDHMDKLAGMFGLKVPYRMSRSQLKNMIYCAPALVTLGVQMQNILRYHIDAPERFRELEKFKLPKGWDRETVTAIHSLLEENAQNFNLGRNNLPTAKFFNVNDVKYDVFRTKAMSLGVHHCAFFPNENSLFKTAIPENFSLLFKDSDFHGFLSGRVPCTDITDSIRTPAFLHKTNICICF